MKPQKLIVACIVIISALAVNAEKTDYYDDLVKLERNMLNGNSYVKKRLDEISEHQSQFTRLEQDFFQLLQAHHDYLSSNLEACKKRLRSLIKQTDSADIRAKANILLATAEHVLGNHVESFIALDKAVSAVPSLQRQRYKASILQTAVGIYRQAELYEFALELARNLQVEAAKLKHGEYLCLANYELGTSEKQTGQIKMAKQRMLLAIEYCKNNDSKIFEYASIISLSELYTEVGELQKSNRELKKIIEAVKNIGWKNLIARLHIAIAHNYLKLEEYDQAEEFALVGYNNAKQGEDKRRIQKSAEVLAQIYSKTGEKDKAIKYYNEVRKLNSANKVKIRQRKLAFDIARRGEKEN